ncbi:RING-type E3 ubiquitin transferase [Malassezia psittaci]|uniref:RING-type E3 ubiquitin transferase n=1 Tax=Malassezia psittaci TaxID=1821823 RepID=A0AAF0F3R3_9BASI|nr:RING-type E3 ubiquitin transferase [Malassezia psittaci]
MEVHAAMLMRTSVLVGYGLVSTAMFAAVILKAGLEQPDYLTAAAWLITSNGCFLVLCNFAVYLLLLSGRLTQLLLFGSLRRSETERFSERLWISMFNIFFTVTSFPTNFDARYLLLIAFVQFFQLFHTLCEVRIEQMGQVTDLPRIFHLRMVALLCWLGASDFSLCALTLMLCSHSFGPGGFMVYISTFQIVQLFEWAKLLGKYICEFYELQQEEPWHAKSRYLRVIEIVTKSLMFLTYPICYGLYYYNATTTFFVSFSALRDFLTLGYALFNNLRTLIRSHAATRDMETRYPSLSEAEVEALSDRTCIICREELKSTSGSGVENDTPKRLVCGHVFHFGCLHSWLERQQSCPTCRRSVLDTTPTTPSPPPNPGREAEARGPANVANPPQRPNITLQSLLARFNNTAPVQSTSTSQSTSAAASMSPSDAARHLFNDPRLDPRPYKDLSTTRSPELSTNEYPESAFGLAQMPESDPDLSQNKHQQSTDVSDRGVREAVRKAALARFASYNPGSLQSSSSAPYPGQSECLPSISLPSESSENKMASVNTAETFSATLNDPRAMQNTPQLDQEDPLTYDTQLREQLRLLEETQIVLQQTIVRLREALRVSDRKGKLPSTSIPT